MNKMWLSILQWLISNGRGRPVIRKLKCSAMSVIVRRCVVFGERESECGRVTVRRGLMEHIPRFKPCARNVYVPPYLILITILQGIHRSVSSSFQWNQDRSDL